MGSAHFRLGFFGVRLSLLSGTPLRASFFANGLSIHRIFLTGLRRAHVRAYFGRVFEPAQVRSDSRHLARSCSTLCRLAHLLSCGLAERISSAAKQSVPPCASCDIKLARSWKAARLAVGTRHARKSEVHLSMGFSVSEFRQQEMSEEVFFE